MAIHSENMNFTKQRNDHHSWQYPAYKRKKKNKAESRKAQKNPRLNFEVKTSNKFEALKVLEANQRNDLKQKSRSSRAVQGTFARCSPDRSIHLYSRAYFTLDSLEEQFRFFHLTKYAKSFHEPPISPCSNLGRADPSPHLTPRRTDHSSIDCPNLPGSYIPPHRRPQSTIPRASPNPKGSDSSNKAV